MIVSLTTFIISALSIIGLIFDLKSKRDTSRYLTYGFIFVSVDVLIVELTYLIPSCMVLFNTHTQFCIALGAIQHLTENITRFFTIGTSMTLLLSVSWQYRKCQCCGRDDYGRRVFIFWTIAGLAYSGFFMIFGLCEGAIGVRGNRCWLCNKVGNLEVYPYQLISYRLISMAVTVMAVIFAIVCHIQIRGLANEHKSIFMESTVKDTVGHKQTMDSLFSLDKSLLRKYVAFTVIGTVHTVASNVIDLLTRRKVINDSNSKYLGWTDVIYIAIYFFSGFIFSFSALKRLLRRMGWVGPSREDTGVVTNGELLAI